MLLKLYTFLCLSFFVVIHLPLCALAENNIDIIKPKEKYKNIGNETNIFPYYDSLKLEEIEESDLFEAKENLWDNENSDTKKWAIKIKVGPFDSKGKAQQAINSIRKQRAAQLFGSLAKFSKEDLLAKSLNFEIIEADPSMELDTNSFQKKFINKNYRVYEKEFQPTDTYYMVEIITQGLPLRVRTNPSLTSTIIHTLKNGTNVPFIGEAVLDNNNEWFEVEYIKGKFGWVSAMYARKNKVYKDPSDVIDNKIAELKPTGKAYKDPSDVIDNQIAELKPTGKVYKDPSDVIDNQIAELKPKGTIDNFRIDKVYNWIKAWESKEVKLYFSFYSNNFKGSKESRSIWESSRRYALTNHSSMTIETKNMNIIRDDKKIKVQFVQIFKSDKLSDIGRKELYWQKEKDDWKIVSEVWSAL